MSSVKRNPSLKAVITELRRRVAQGDVSAMCDLATWLQEGLQDKKGRAIIRRDPAYAFR